MSHNKSFKLALLATCVCISPVAMAQTAAPPPAQTEPPATAPAAAPPPVAEEASGNEIIVTAQRREQRLQDVPLAVSVASASQLSAAGITNTEKLSTIVPGLVITQQRTGYSPYLRGVGTQNTAVGDEPAVATYVDGVYMASASSVVFDMNNIDRVEVLRGPQGTLFGRNATGGLISITTRTPSHDTLVEGSVSYGNYNTKAGNLYATTGISENAAIDLALTGKYQSDGFGRNLTLNKDAFYHRSWGARSKVLWEPSDAVTVTLAGDFSRKTSDFGADRGIYPGAVTTPGTVGGVVVEPGTTYQCFRCSYDKNDKTPVTKNYGLSMTVKADVGAVTLSSTTAWRYLLSNYVTDTDGGAPRVNDSFLREHTDTVQQEFVANGDAGRLAYTAGLFLFYSDGGHDPLLTRSQFNPAGNIDRYVNLKTSSYAPFFQGTYDFGEGTSLTGGLRYTADKRSYDGVNYASSFAAGGSPGPKTVALLRQDESTVYRKVTWRGALDHKFSKDFMVYGTISRGFKSGAYNSTVVGTPPARPETLDAYEVGFKSSLFDRQLIFNVSAFHYDYKDIQLFAVINGTTAFLLNAAAGKLDGADFEAVFSPHLDHGKLSLSARAGYLPRAEYVNFPNAQFFYPRPATACGPVTSPNPSQTTGAPTGGNLQCVGDASGNRMIKAPKITATFSADYSVPVGEHRVAFNATLSHNSGFNYDPDNRLKQKSFQLLNGSVGYYLKDDRIGVRAFASNLLNKKWISSVQSSAFSDSTFMADPRTYGAALEFKL